MCSTMRPQHVFTESAPRLIQSISCDVHLFVCVFMPAARTRKRVYWRLFVKNHIAKIAKLRSPSFGSFEQLFGF